MKILLINLWRVINSQGGTEKVFFNMANALAQRGHNVIAVGVDGTEGKPFFPVDERVKFVNPGKGFKLKKTIRQKINCSLRSGEEKEKYTEKIYDSLRSERLASVIAKEQFDVVISYNTDATRILINTFHIKQPIITMFHFDPETILKNMTAKTKEALGKCACVQVLLPSYIKTTKKYVNNKIVYIPNVVPKYDSTYENREKCIVNVARVDSTQKRQLLLIEAFNKVKYKYPDWRVEIWGETNVDKAYYKKCKEKLAEYKLHKAVLFCGTTDKVMDVYRKASIFVFPSAYEGFPLALTEAMSAGVPAIGCKSCSAVNELIIDGENGLLCDDGIEPLAEALDKLMSDKELRIKMGKAAKADMRQYEPEKIWDQWEELLKVVIRNNRL